MKLVTAIVTLACVLNTTARNANATTQIPDRLQTGIWTHEVHGENIPSDILYGTNRFASHNGFCTACLRGYVAEWKIQDGRLYLVSAKTFQGTSVSATADNLTVGGPVHATWITGEFYSPKVAVLLVPSSYFGGIHVGYLVFAFKDGQLLSRRFQMEPIGAAIFLVELLLIWLFVRWIMRRRRRLAQPTSAGAVATRAAPEK